MQTVTVWAVFAARLTPWKRLHWYNSIEALFSFHPCEAATALIAAGIMSPCLLRYSHTSRHAPGPGILTPLRSSR